jgi:hypothetical protein
MTGLTYPQVATLLYDLFVRYVFGSMELTMIGLFVIVAYISWKMHVTADGWVLVLGGYGAVIGWIYLSPSGLPALVGIALGVTIYFLVRRLDR